MGIRGRGVLRHVEAGQARQAGLSWAEIGTLLGVTRQAMHQKYGKA